MDGPDGTAAVNRIQVVVRVRPVLPHETSEAIAVTCSPDGTRVQVALPEKETSKPAIAASARPDAKAYSFDACLTGSTTQAQLSDICGMDELVEAAVDGYNVTVFAFGQTGSGKTYSVIGPSLAGFQEAAWSAGNSSSQQHALGTPAAEYVDSPAENSATGQQLQHSGSDRSTTGNSTAPPAEEDDGLLPRCITHLYSCIAERKQEMACRVLTSCVEIYNEAVTDLFARNKAQQLQVRYNDSSEGFYVDGLTQKEVASNNKALQLMSDALMYRHTRAHRLNQQSSRSHCLITFTVASQELATQGRAGVRRVGKLVLVDLAGSERLKDTGNTAKDAVRETGSINKSLFTLGQVLAALSVRSGCGITGHVPYRDSKLTQLLWDGLKGGGRALMLACLSPLKAHADESLNTLHFASMALRIKSQPIIMMDPQDQMVLEMRDMIKALQTDCRSLAAAVTQMSTGVEMSSVLQSLPPTLVQDALRYGSASAPTSQQPRQLSPARPDRQLRASGGRTPGMGNKFPGALIKPGTADTALRHSLPTLYSSNSPNKDSPSRRKQQQQQQLMQSWNSSPKANSIAAVYQFQQSPNQLTGIGPGSISSNIRSSWPAYATPPRSGNSSPQRGSLSPTASLMARAAAAAHSYSGGSMAYAPGSPAKQPVWTGVSKYPGLAAREAAFAAPADGGVGYNQAAAAYYGNSYAMGSLGPATAAAAGLPPGQIRSVMDFPELAALEQQFMQQQFNTPQQQQQQQQQQGVPDNIAGLITQPGGPVQEYAAIGTNSFLVASGLPASIQAPTSLVPVRLGITDTETVGTSPNASPVVVAIAAAENQVRPIAVPLRRVTRTGPGEGASAGASSSGGQQQDSVAAAAAAQVEQRLAPEPEALGWAARNMWFGADTDMTQLAYQVHDELVAHGVDPSSDAYYAAIEHKVAEQLPQKWMQWQAIMAAAASSTALGRSKQQQQQPQSFSNYTSYRVPLKSAVPRLSGAAAGAVQNKPTNSLEASNWMQHQQQQQQQVQQQPLWRPSGVAASNQQQQMGLAAAAADQQWHQSSPQQHQQQVYASPTLSVLLQPKVSFGGLYNPNQQQQQQLVSGAVSLPGRAFSEQMLALYQQHNSAGQSALQQQGQNQAMSQVSMQQQQEMVPPSPIGSIQGLPELHLSASPVPTSPAGAGAGMASLIQPGLPSQLMYNTNFAAVNPLQGMYQQQQQLQQQQQASRLGGVTAAAGQVLANSQASYYDGAGPLTVGSKQNWNASRSSKNIQAGRDLAEILRSGLSPGNKSMADLQADYRAARALVLDQLRQQKEETEQQKKRILLQIGRAINSSKWQT